MLSNNQLAGQALHTPHTFSGRELCLPSFKLVSIFGRAAIFEELVVWQFDFWRVGFWRIDVAPTWVVRYHLVRQNLNKAGIRSEVLQTTLKSVSEVTSTPGTTWPLGQRPNIPILSNWFILSLIYLRWLPLGLGLTSKRSLPNFTCANTLTSLTYLTRVNNYVLCEKCLKIDT